jgi:hypothetical protein
MSISTYSELQTAVGTWLDDTSLSSYIPDFITLGQSRINRDLDKIRTSWTTGTLTGTVSSRSLTIPSAFVEAGNLWLLDTDQILLTPFVAGTRELSNTSGKPTAWCINNTTIDLDVPCDSAYTFYFRYRAKWDIVTDLTNWLLTNHPDVYLAASLIEAFSFRGNEDQAVKWEVRYRQAVDDINRKEARSQVAPLVVDAALQSAPVFDYTSGL